MKKYQTGHWTGFRAVINGVSFNIQRYTYHGDFFVIDLMNGKTATVDKRLAERVTT